MVTSSILYEVSVTTTTETDSGLPSVSTWDTSCTTRPSLGSREKIVLASPLLVVSEGVGGGFVLAIAAEISDMAGARNTGIEAVGDLVVWLCIGK